MSNFIYIDLFAGAGGLSEGFIKEGFCPVTHVEMNKEACDTLKTRLAFHHLTELKNSEKYYSYLKMKVLFIEDDETLGQNLIKSFNDMEIAGHIIKAELKTSFAEGITAISTFDYDIAILDLF